jgi:hypothetical protein
MKEQRIIPLRTAHQPHRRFKYRSPGRFFIVPVVIRQEEDIGRVETVLIWNKRTLLRNGFSLGMVNRACVGYDGRAGAREKHERTNDESKKQDGMNERTNEKTMEARNGTQKTKRRRNALINQSLIARASFAHPLSSSLSPI